MSLRKARRWEVDVGCTICASKTVDIQELADIPTLHRSRAIGKLKPYTSWAKCPSCIEFVMVFEPFKIEDLLVSSSLPTARTSQHLAFSNHSYLLGNFNLTDPI